MISACRGDQSMGKLPVGAADSTKSGTKKSKKPPVPADPKLGIHFHKTKPQPLPVVKTGADFGNAVARSIDFLLENNKKPGARLAKGIPESDLLTTLFSLQSTGCLTPVFLEKYFDFYLINTRKEDDKTQFTGYFTPIMTASRSQNAGFPVPIYRRPAELGDNLPSRSAIKKGALSGKKLDVGWLKNMADLRSIQMQGSCFLKFPDGKMQLIGWDGTNNDGKSQLGDDGVKTPKTGRDEFNYVFFKPMKSAPTGAMSEVLTKAVSLSVDPDIVPLGATLLAELVGPDGRPDYHLLLAQDVGGGIQGTKRFDLYCGIGQPFSPAIRVNDYGKIWLVLPKK